MHPFEVLAHPLKSLTDDVFELKAAGEKKVFRMWEMKDESLKSEPDFKDVLYCFFSHYSLFGWVKSSSHLLSVRRCNEFFFFQNFLTAAVSGLMPPNCLAEQENEFPTVVTLSCHGSQSGTHRSKYEDNSFYLCLDGRDTLVACELPGRLK